MISRNVQKWCVFGHIWISSKFRSDSDRIVSVTDNNVDSITIAMNVNPECFRHWMFQWVTIIGSELLVTDNECGSKMNSDNWWFPEMCKNKPLFRHVWISNGSKSFSDWQ